MVAIKGLGGLPEPQPQRPTSVRDGKAKNTAKAEMTTDGVVISNEAQAAATLARVIQVAQEAPDIRASRVSAARENIERGDYRRPEVVAKVAERISKYLP